MGCDIHLYVELQQPDNPPWPGEWVHDRDPRFIEEYDFGPEDRGFWPRWPGHGRNYAQFAILANVRNGRRLMNLGDGRETDGGEQFKPIAMPRGLPDDVSAEVLAESESWGVDGHSHSWLTLRELVEFDWDQTVTLRALCRDVEDEGRWKDGGKAAEVQKIAQKYGSPPPWAETAGGVWGTHEDEWVEIEWEAAYWQMLSRDSSWSNGSLYRLMQILTNKTGGHLDNARIVFWFDN